LQVVGFAQEGEQTCERLLVGFTCGQRDAVDLDAVGQTFPCRLIKPDSPCDLGGTQLGWLLVARNLLFAGALEIAVGADRRAGKRGDGEDAMTDFVIAIEEKVLSWR
jgi:hypothetical protein